MLWHTSCLERLPFNFNKDTNLFTISPFFYNRLPINWYTATKDKITNTVVFKAMALRKINSSVSEIDPPERGKLRYTQIRSMSKSTVNQFGFNGGLILFPSMKISFRAIALKSYCAMLVLLKWPAVVFKSMALNEFNSSERKWTQMQIESKPVSPIKQTIWMVLMNWHPARQGMQQQIHRVWDYIKYQTPIPNQKNHSSHQEKKIGTISEYTTIWSEFWWGTRRGAKKATLEQTVSKIHSCKPK